MDMLEDVFVLLETAKRLEKKPDNRIEAATKYYEAVYLIRQVLLNIPHDEASEPTRRLLTDKIEFYTQEAQRLYFDDSSTAPSTIQVDPRSPLSANGVIPHKQDPQKPPPPPPSSSSSESPRFTQSAYLNRIAGQANKKLGEAIELDERNQRQAALQAYLKASELFLQAIKQTENNLQSKPSSSSSLLAVLTRRLEGALDRVEQLKHPNRPIMAQSKAGDVRTTTTSTTKTFANGTSGGMELSKDEIAVLKQSSRIESGLFLPWSEEEARALSEQVQNLKAVVAKPWKDPDGDLKLSEKQKRKFYQWARPMDIAQRRNAAVKQKPPVMIRSINPYTIRQAYVTDCSFIASLCICSLFEKRFRKRLVTSIIYPQDKHGIPIYNPLGKYYVKLWLNGVARVVVVDDTLPIDRHSNILASHTSSNGEGRHQLELWVSIIEKAYMKMCGGYDFPGSNSGIDLFSLTGWIPERIFFPKNPQKVRDFETAPERAWDRIFSAASFGDCLITVSTTRELTEDQADALGLVTGHAYAVLHVVESRNGTRLLQLKNPWAEKGWKGKYSPHDNVSWKEDGLATELGYNPSLAAQHDDGVFWIGWDDVLCYFRNIQLSWNPSLFAFRVTTHAFWPKDKGEQDDTFNVGENPQYILELSREAIEKNATVWVLISRHTRKIDDEDESFLTIHVVRSGCKQRVWYPHGPNTVINGAYTNNPHVLVRYDVTGDEDRYLSLVLSQHEKRKDLAYTLSVFCTEPFSLGRPSRVLPFSMEIPSSWSPSIVGGAVGTKSFFRNPMFAITIGENMTLQLRCSTSKTIAVNVMMLAIPPGTSLTNCRNTAAKSRGGKPILDSGNYRHAFVATEPTSVLAGSYVIILSTWSGQMGSFNLYVASSLKLPASHIVQVPS